MISLTEAEKIANQKAHRYSKDLRDDIRQEILLRIYQTKPEDTDTAWRIANHAAWSFLRRELTWRQGSNPNVTDEDGNTVSLIDLLPDMRMSSASEARQSLLDIPLKVRRLGLKIISGIPLTDTERKRLQRYRESVSRKAIELAQ